MCKVKLTPLHAKQALRGCRNTRVVIPDRSSRSWTLVSFIPRLLYREK
jgi:hypothetical protein